MQVVQAKESNILDALRDGYNTITDKDLLQGIIGSFTNTLGYVTNKVTEEEYYNFLNGFADYTNNYDLALDDHIQFDAKNKTITIDKDLQKMMYEYINQDSAKYGLMKLTSNPSLIAKQYVYLKGLIQNHSYYDEILNIFDAIMSHEGLGVMMFDTSYEGRLAIDYHYYPNGSTNMTRLYLTERMPYPQSSIAKIFFSSVAQPFSVRLTPMESLNESLSFDYGSSFSIYLDEDVYYKPSSSTYNRWHYVDITNKIASEQKWFLFGKGVINAYVDPSIYSNNQITNDMPYYSDKFYNYNGDRDMILNSDYVVLGDHYQYYQDMRTTINNYITENPSINDDGIKKQLEEIKKLLEYHVRDNPTEPGTEPGTNPGTGGNNSNILSEIKDKIIIVISKLDDVINAINKVTLDITNVENGGSNKSFLDWIFGLIGVTVEGLFEIVLNSLKNISSAFISIISNITGFLIDGLSNMINSMFSALRFDDYSVELNDDSNFFSFIASLFTLIPKPIISAWKLIFIASTVLIILKKFE